MKSLASLVIVSGPSEAKSTESTVHQLSPLVFMWVGHSLLRHFSRCGMATRPSGKIAAT